MKKILFLIFLTVSCFKNIQPIESIQIQNINVTTQKISANIRWTTNYNSKCTSMINDIVFETTGLNHTINIDNLQSNTDYTYSIVAEETMPLSSIYKKPGYYEGSFKTLDKDNIIISNVTIEQIWSTHQLYITWNTDIASSAIIEFDIYNIYGFTTTDKNFSVTTQELNPDQEYSFKITASPYDAINYKTTEHNFNFFVNRYIPIEMTWTNQSNQFGTDIIYDIIYANNQYVAIGGNGKLQTSQNSTDWTLRDSGFGTYFIYGVCYGDKYVIVGNSGSTAISTDGITWTYQQTNSYNYTHIYSVAYGKNIYVSGGALGKLATSNDGIVWTQQTSQFGTDSIMYLTFINNYFFASGTNGKIAYSSNGINWTLINAGFNSTDTIFGCGYNNNLYYCYGSDGKIATSKDLNTWEYPDSSFGSSTIKRIIYSDSIYVSVGYNGKIAVSPDMIHFTQISNTFGTNNIRSICYNDKFVAVGDNGKMSIGAKQ